LAIERHRCKAPIAAISSDPKMLRPAANPATPLLTLRFERKGSVCGDHRHRAAAIAGVVRRVLSTKRRCEIGDIVNVLEVEANNAKKIVS
jgi:hypothetical protein